MQTTEINRTIIYHTVKHALTGMKQNPGRTIRNLTDLGMEFSKTPLQGRIFSTLQTLLSCEDSPYYEMLEQLFSYTAEESLLTFGMNVGYNSLIAGRRMAPYPAPWLFLPEMSPDKANLKSLSRTIQKGTKLGIYSYWIDGETPVCEELYGIFQAHADCAFFHTLKAGCQPLSVPYTLLAKCPNVMTLLPADSPKLFETVVDLRSHGLLYGIYRYYGTEHFRSSIADLLTPALSCRSAFYFLIAREDCPERNRFYMARKIQSLRQKQQYPVLLSDVYSDLSTIEKLLAESL